ncbi:TonB-dependent receptor [Parapedobacter sp. SGR-10]|nr:TonB-dependent receptor [Parapedobacter sp. SGR-10]
MALLGFAQHDVSIRVVDNHHQVLVGATVTLDRISKQTDERGIASFAQTSDKTLPLQVTYLGYRPHNGRISTNQAQHSITLEALHLQTGEVFVSATRAGENAATTFKNINKDELRQNNLGQDIPYLLEQTPGMVIGSDAGAGIGYTSMRIRGSDNQRINVTLNGIPLNDAESMGSFFVNLPDFASSVESIQIQRGIGTSTNGAGAFGASLNIQTDALEEGPYAELNNSFGSFNSWKNTVKVGSGLIQNKYAFNARLSRIASDGYVDRATSDLKSFYVDGGIYTDKHILKATVFSGKEKTYQAWNGISEDKLESDRTYNGFTYDNQTDNYTQTHAHLHYTSYFNDKVNLNVAAHYTRGAGYYEEYRENDKFSNYGLENVFIRNEDGDVLSEIKRSDMVRRRWLDNHFYGLTYSLNYKASDQLNLTFGGAANQYLGDHYGQVIWAQYASNSTIDSKYYLNDAKKTDINLYAKADYRVNNWLFNLDLQGRHVNYKASGDDNKIKNFSFEDDLSFFNPKIGTTYFINGHSNIYVSYAYAGKEPVRKDYVENPRNEFPKPEQMQDIEAGYRFRNEQFNVGTNLYAMLYKDQLVPTGTLNDTGGALRFNIPDSYRIGIELDGSWAIHPMFTWSATAALSQNKIKDFVEYIPVYNEDWEKLHEETVEHGTTNIAMSPSTVLSNDFTFKATNTLSFSLLTKYVSRLYLDNTSATERSIDPYFVNHIRALYTFKALGLERVDLNLTVNNIFNSKYETSGYTWREMYQGSTDIAHYNYYYPQAGTNFMLGLNIRF